MSLPWGFGSLGAVALKKACVAVFQRWPGLLRISCSCHICATERKPPERNITWLPVSEGFSPSGREGLLHSWRQKPLVQDPYIVWVRKQREIRTLDQAIIFRSPTLGAYFLLGPTL